jgi:hypothetical protein
MDNQVRNLWGRDFNLVDKGLSEPEVVTFVNELLGQHGSSGRKREHSAALTKLVERMVIEADKFAAEIKAEAEAEAANIREVARAEATQIEAGARREVDLLTNAAKHRQGDEIVSMKDACLKLLSELDSLINDLSSLKASSLTESQPIPEPEPSEAPISTPTHLPASPESREEMMEALSQLRPETDDQVLGAAPEPAVVPVSSLGQPEESVEECRPDEEEAALYEGQVELIVAPSATSDQLMGLQWGLQQIPGARVMRTSGSPAGGTIITIFVEQPLPLARILRGMSCVKSCVKEIVDGEVEKRSPFGGFLKKSIHGQRPKSAPGNRILIGLGSNAG